MKEILYVSFGRTYEMYKMGPAILSDLDRETFA